jgi:hypothetical protein
VSCLKPVPFNGRYAPCSRCEPCRRSRAFVTVSRLLVEGLAHSSISFLTLTYAPRHLPAGGSLFPSHVVSWARRFRRTFDYHSSARLRLFVVGEYGSAGARPHYHVVCFGADLSTVVGGRSFSDVVRSSWRLGDVYIGDDWSESTAGYVSAYVAKGHNVAGLDVLRGRHPEFSRWPTRPGLGVPGLRFLLPSVLDGRDPRAVVQSDGDLPFMFELHGRTRPLGSFLMSKARQAAGLSSSEVAALKARAVEAARLEARASYPDRVADLVGGDVDEIVTTLAMFSHGSTDPICSPVP